MLKNQLLTIWRQIKSHPWFYLLNIGGLSVGMAAFLIMYNYSAFELSFDKYHDSAEDVYRLNLHFTPEDDRPDYHAAVVFAGVAPTLLNEAPQVEAAGRLVEVFNDGVVSIGDHAFFQDLLLYADPGILDVLTFDFVEGNPEEALRNIRTLIISNELKQRLFPDQQAVGKLVKVLTNQGEEDYLIDGVFKKRKDTHLQTDVLLSWSSQRMLSNYNLDQNWVFFDYVTYVKLKAGSQPADVEAMMPGLIDKYRRVGSGSSVLSIDLMPVTDIHLNSHLNQEISQNGDRNTVIFLIVLAVLTLAIAWVNYINLYTARVLERGKEVGIRKTLGSTRHQVRKQFLLEACLSNFCATCFAILLSIKGTKLIFSTLGITVDFGFYQKPSFWLLTLILWGISTVTSGLYPSWVISNYQALKAIRSVNMKSSGRLRRLLVTGQFLASSVLLVGASIVYFQLREMNNTPLGIETADVVNIEAPNFTGDWDRYEELITAYKNQIQSIPGVELASYSSDVPGKQVGWRGGTQRVGNNLSTSAGMIFKVTTEADYFNLYDVRFVAGRNFDLASDSLKVIINEQALELYGFDNAEEAINERLSFFGMDTLRVVGVIKDYYQESLQELIKPTAFFRVNEELSNLSVKYLGEDFGGFISRAEDTFSEFFPGTPFMWETLNDRLGQRHLAQLEFFKTFRLFVFLSLFISALGLIGLVTFTVKKKTKEIGIRKVLGSPVLSLFMMIFKEFIRLALVGNLVAVPVIYFFAENWLNQFPNRIDFIWWLPMAAFCISMFLAFVSTIYHISRAALLNPVNVLRSE